MHRRLYHRWLRELTSLPTAAGCEGRVLKWILDWAAARRDCAVSSDRFGNLTVAANQRSRRKSPPPPIYLTAHLDHPAFVVSQIIGPRELIADFRGGVADSYFVGASVLLHARGARPQRGTIVSLEPPKAGASLDKAALVRFPRNVAGDVGDMLTWELPATTIRGDRVMAPACDDLAGVAAALAAFDVVQRAGPSSASAHARPGARTPRLALLFTRCEEVGFIGAIAACKARTMPKNALIIALENSKSFAESPIGAGPIVRVGDRTSTFDPDLTYRVGKVAEALGAENKSFQWQRKLMPGGTCEASAYQTYGHTATCLCLPLGNYHNMNEATGKIDREVISLRDFDNLVLLLAEVARRLHDPKLAPPLKARLEGLFKSRRRLIQ
jgi:endoglucanase